MNTLLVVVQYVAALLAAFFTFVAMAFRDRNSALGAAGCAVIVGVIWWYFKSVPMAPTMAPQ